MIAAAGHRRRAMADRDLRLGQDGAHAIGDLHVLSATLGFEGEEDRDRAADWLRANGFTVEKGGAA